MQKPEILEWLREERPERLETLWARADETRRRHVGDAVHLRGLIELSNYCVRACAYCGIRAGNRAIERYRMTAPEVLACAAEAVAFGFGTVVLQSGEDDGLDATCIADLVRQIKTTTPLAVTLSLGERAFDELRTFRAAGADRYLLRFETSDSVLYRRIHPPRHGQPAPDRFAWLAQLRELGYEVGSGVMVGIPGQTFETLATDIELFGRLDLDMIGIGPFIPHPGTPLGRGTFALADDQVPPSEDMVYKAVALARIVCPQANIPSTTALATINRAEGRELGLQRGANVVMPNLTPLQYRRKYEIYPDKACIDEASRHCVGCLSARIARIGRAVGVGPGGRQKPAGAAGAEVE